MKFASQINKTVRKTKNIMMLLTSTIFKYKNKTG